MAMLWLMVPYVKTLVPGTGLWSYKDMWDGKICLQSKPFTCGPASAATVLNSLGLRVTEQELGEECHTYIGGTENWYIARALRRRGFQVDFLVKGAKPQRLYYPAIAGVRLSNGAGHFVAVLAETDKAYVIGDPQDGKHLVDKRNLDRDYLFTGFFLIVNPPMEQL
jgi:ABC-type bacteriocin/lantibiotic exporter with double-glycine peptidase domain